MIIVSDTTPLRYLIEIEAAPLLAALYGKIIIPHLPTIRLFTILESAAERELLDLPSAIARMQQTTFRLPPDTIITAMLERDRLRKLHQGTPQN